jgi:FKBP-type peptidyl-prolyl cis-trans isomerase
MQPIKIRLTFGAFLFLFCSFAYADFSRPAGIWDIQGQAVVKGTLPGGKAKIAKTPPVYSFVQFKEDGAYTTIPWLPTSGQWTTQKNNTKAYQVSFDFGAVNSGQTRPPFLNAMLGQYLAIVQKQYKNVSKFKAIEIKSYSDRGKLVRKMQIIGVQKISATLTFTDPDTQQELTGSVKTTLNYVGWRASAPSTCCTSGDAAQNQADSEAFLKENAKLPWVKTTNSGLQYRILAKGDEKSSTPTASDKVTVSYLGILPSGQLFDNNKGLPASFPLNGVISGFAEGLQLMKVGAYYRFYLPPELAYGASGRGTVIKPNTALIFDVSLQKIN